jgi:hypothetical protein
MENELQNGIHESNTVTIPEAEYEELLSLKAHHAELEQQVQWLMEQVQLAKHKQFGVSSEKSEYDQSCLFNETEVSADEKAPEPELVEVEKHYRKKAHESEGRLPPDLPVEVV